MDNKIMKELETVYKKELGELTIGDSEATEQFKLLDNADLSLENILIATLNLIKVNQTRISNLENNLFTLASRVHDSVEDFTSEEIEEIKNILDTYCVEDLQNISKDKCLIGDLLYFDIEDFDLMTKKQNILINKIAFPTIKMDDTFKSLLKIAMDHAMPLAI